MDEPVSPKFSSVKVRLSNPTAIYTPEVLSFDLQ